MRLIMFFALLSTSLFSAEFTMKDGKKINATVLKHTPGTFQLQSASGVVKEFSEKDFKGESLARMLPKDNVYEVALSVGDQFSSMYKTMEAQEVSFSNQVYSVLGKLKSVTDKYAAILDILSKYDNAGLLPKKLNDEVLEAISGKENLLVKDSHPQSISNKYNIPREVLEKIQYSAKQVWPDDYRMQVFVIDKEVAAYKKLQADK